MLHTNRPWMLKAYKDYENQPEKYQEKNVGIRPKLGEFQQFQVHDVNCTLQGKLIYGYIYLRLRDRFKGRGCCYDRQDSFCAG